MNHEFLINNLRKSRISVVITHGSSNSIQTSNSPITTTTINGLETNAFSNSNLILYLACSTGSGREDNSYNLVNATAGKGAKTVIGFEKKIMNVEADYWGTEFFQTIKQDSKTIEDACNAADEYVKLRFNANQWDLNKITTDSWYIAGNKTAVLS